VALGHQGILNALKGSGVTLKSTIYDTTHETSGATTKIAAALSADPSITGIYAWIQTQSNAALAALRQVGRKDVAVVTNYAGYEQIPDLRAGRYAGVGGQPAAQIGTQAVQQAYNAVNDKPVEKQMTLPAFVLTKDNIDTPEAKPYLFFKSCNV
jgi:ribose transport system substrate-binding protein